MELPEVHQSVRGTTIQLPDRGLENWVRVRELVRIKLGSWKYHAVTRSASIS